MQSQITIYDFDGTLVKGDTVVDFLVYLGCQRWWIAILFSPFLLIGLLLQITTASSTLGLKLALFGLSIGLNKQHFVKFCTNFGSYWIRRHFHNRIIEEVVLDLKHQLSLGNRVILATGSIDIWVESIIFELTGQKPEIVGTTWYSGLCGIKISRRCFRREKLLMLEEYFSSPLVNHRAFGNSSHDRWFIESASEKYIVNPSSSLRQYMIRNKIDCNEIISNSENQSGIKKFFQFVSQSRLIRILIPSILAIGLYGSIAFGLNYESANVWSVVVAESLRVFFLTFVGTYILEILYFWIVKYTNSIFASILAIVISTIGNILISSIIHYLVKTENFTASVLLPQIIGLAYAFLYMVALIRLLKANDSKNN